LTLAQDDELTTTESMTYDEYKQNLSDIKYLIKYPKFGNHATGKFGIFQADGWYCIWDMDASNVVVACKTATGNKILRVRKESPYADALLQVKGYTCVKSSTLGMFHSKRGSINTTVYIRYIAEDQLKHIANLEEPTDVVIDLGPKETLRNRILRRLEGGLYRRSDIVAIRKLNPRTREHTVRLGPVDTGGERPHMTLTQNRMLTYYQEYGMMSGQRIVIPTWGAIPEEMFPTE
jgi:hypothetical protein